MRGKVEQELDRLQKKGIIKPVKFSDWAAPIVPVLKKKRLSPHLWRLPTHSKPDSQVDRGPASIPVRRPNIYQA